MGYQALLFCGDEATAGLVTQVLNELEFSVERANEPFAAVKRLTTQHFDAVVVDCENEQNAALLFKSARNSGPNKTSLAVAVVEGQPGIAKAFRIGANLVLTKPINVEQSKGTLRVARGLLKKPEAGKPAASQTPAAPAAKAPMAPAMSRPLTPVAPVLKPVVPPKSVTSRPAPPMVRAEAPSLLELDAEPTPQTESTDAALLASMPEAPAPKAVMPKAAWPPAGGGSKTFPGSDAATGVAPAREPAHRHTETLEPKQSAYGSATTEYARPMPQGHASESHAPAHVPAPSFGAAPAQSSSGGIKWVLIAAAILLAAAGGYFVSTKLHSGSSAAVSNAPAQSAPAQSAPAPQTAAPAPAASTVAQPSSAAQQQAAAPASHNAAPEETADDASSESPKKSSAAAAKSQSTVAEKPSQTLVVKSAPKSSQNDVAPQAIPVIGMASNSGDKGLSGIMQGASSARTPVLKTVKVSQGVSQGLVIKRVSPDYPSQARQLRIEGTVQLDATIGKDGSVSNLKVVSGHPILARAALEAVKQWKYRPYLLNGQAVEIDTQIAINFKLP